MDAIHVLGYLGALSAGLLLGLMGSGGSILSVPIFTYLFHVSPLTTTAYSLFVVGTTASIGTLRSWKKNLIDFKVTLVFGIPAFITVYVVRKYILPVIPLELISFSGFSLSRDTVIMVFFGIVMLFASISMIRKKKTSKEDHNTKPINYPLIILVGILIGLLTGIIGIGGGFLIIPALVFILNLPMKKAIATSLFIIALKSLIGFAGDFVNLQVNWSFLLGFTAISVIGICIGTYAASYIDGEKLKKSFGWFVLTMSVVILCKELFM